MTIAHAVDDAAVMAAIEQAFADHLVLFFRDQRDLTPETHVRFASHFGPIEAHGYTTTDPDNPDVTVIDVTNPVGPRHRLLAQRLVGQGDSGARCRSPRGAASAGRGRHVLGEHVRGV